MRTQSSKSLEPRRTDRCIANAIGCLPYGLAQWQGDLVMADLAKVQSFPIRSHRVRVARHLLLSTIDGRYTTEETSFVRKRKLTSICKPEIPETNSMNEFDVFCITLKGSWACYEERTGMSVHARAVASSQRQPARPCNAVPSIIPGTKRYGCIAASLSCPFCRHTS